MKCDLFDERMQLIDGALSVLSTQRDIVRQGSESLEYRATGRRALER